MEDISFTEIKKILLELNIELSKSSIIEFSNKIKNLQSDYQILNRYSSIINKKSIKSDNLSINTFECVVHSFSDFIYSDEKYYQNLLDLDIINKTDILPDGKLKFNPTDKILHRIFERFPQLNRRVYGNYVNIPTSLLVEFITDFKYYKTINWLNIQSKSKFLWSYDVLIAGIDIWDWSEISSNKNIKWDAFMIAHFKDNINWNVFSGNSSIEWSEYFIDKYYNYINFKVLSGNKKFYFNRNIYNRYGRNLDLDKVIINSPIVWTMELIELVIKKDKDNKFIINPSSQFVNLIKYSKLDMSSIIELSIYFDNTITVNRSIRRNSDGTHYYDTTHSLWELISANNNIYWQGYVIEMYIKKLNLRQINNNAEISWVTVNKLWDYVQPFDLGYIEDYDGNRDEIPPFEFKIALKNWKIVGLTYDIFLDNEFKWWGYLNSDKFLNPSIEKTLKEYFNM